MKYYSFILFFFCATYVKGQELFPLQSKHSSTKEIVDIKIKSPEGDYIFLKDFLTNDKNYIVSIMASWCGPCRTELDAFQKVHQQWDNLYNTQIIALSIDKPSDSKKVFDMAIRQGWDMCIFHEDMAYTSRELDVHGIPQTFIVNTKGEITYHSKGYSSNLIQKFESELKKLK